MSQEELVESCINLAYKIAHTYGHTDEHISDALFGLVKAANTYKEDSGVKFATYASMCIHNELRMKYRRDKRHWNDVSLDSAITSDSEGHELSLSDTIEYIEEGFERLVKEAEAEDIRALVGRLTPVERDIILMLYGFNGRQYTQHEVAVELGLSQSYISRKERQIIVKLRRLSHGTSIAR